MVARATQEPKAMIYQAPDVIVLAPWGRYTTTGSAVVWCASRRLCGACVWGHPGAEETRAITRLFDQYPRVMDPTFDIILDTRAVEGVDAEALKVLTGWMWSHRAALLERVRISSVIREAPTGFLLAGLLPAIADSRSFRVTTSAATAFRAILGDAGVAAAEELDAIVAGLRHLPREVQAVRAALARRLDTTVDEVARDLAMSARSLQRALSSHGTTFHDEVIAARLTAACELLLSTDLSVAAIATRLGISERALTMLFKSKTDLAPVEWRTRNRPAGSAPQ